MQFATQRAGELLDSKGDGITAMLLLGAGCAVLAGSSYSSGWMSEFTLCLGLIVLAAALSVGAIARSAKKTGEIAPMVAGPRRLSAILAALVLVHCLAAFYIERVVPGTDIDCFTFQRDAVKTFLRGADPYGATQVNIYSPAQSSIFYGPAMVVNGRVQVGFQYPPLTLLWAIPGYLLGDVRYSYVLAVVVSAVLCFAMYPNVPGLCLASFLLLNPVGLYVESRCWTEPLVFMSLCATLYASMKTRRWLPVAVGLFLATKQYNLLALPFLGSLVVPFRWRSYLKLVGGSLAVAAATILPFAWWNSRGLWHDLVLFHLAQPFRADSLSLAVPFPVLLKLGPLPVATFAGWGLWIGMRREAMFAAGYGTCLLLFFSTGKQAFTNYYFLVGQVLLLAAVGFHYIQSTPCVEAAARIEVAQLS